MNRVRQSGSVIVLFVLCIGLGVVAAACHKNVPPVAAAAPPPPPPPTVTPPPPAPPPPPPPAPVPAPPALTEEQIFQRKTLDQLNAERPLGDAFFDLDKSEIRADATGPLQTGCRLAEEVDERPGNRRGALRLARQLGVQPRAWHAPRQCGPGLSGQSGRPISTTHGGQQGQGTALLHGGKRVLLAAEPAGTLRHHREIGQRTAITMGQREGAEVCP